MATYYLSPGGHGDTPNDLNPGTNITLPWATPSKAFLAPLLPGDIVEIRGGTWGPSGAPIGNVNIQYMNHSGAAGNPIIYRAYQNEHPIMNFNTWPGAGAAIQIWAGAGVPVSYLTFQGFEIQGATFGFKIDGGCNTCVWSNMTIHDSGIGINGYCFQCTVDRSKFYHIGYTPSTNTTNHSLYVHGNNWTITNNIFWDTTGSHLQLDCGDYSATNQPSALYAGCANSIIANNTIGYTNSGPAVFFWAGESNLQAYNNVIFENNLFIQNNRVGIDGAGIYLYSMPNDTNTVIRNNLFWDTTGQTGNICVHNGSFLFSCSDNTFSTLWTSTNNVFGVNPLLVNAPATFAGTPDYHPTASSPLAPNGPVNLGLNLTGVVPTLDYDGIQRPASGAWEAGAFEFSGGGPDITPPAIPTGLRVI